MFRLTNKITSKVHITGALSRESARVGVTKSPVMPKAFHVLTSAYDMGPRQICICPVSWCRLKPDHPLRGVIRLQNNMATKYLLFKKQSSIQKWNHVLSLYVLIIMIRAWWYYSKTDLKKQGQFVDEQTCASCRSCTWVTLWHGNTFYITDPLWGESITPQSNSGDLTFSLLLTWAGCWKTSELSVILKAMTLM